MADGLTAGAVGGWHLVGGDAPPVDSPQLLTGLVCVARDDHRILKVLWHLRFWRRGQRSEQSPGRCEVTHQHHHLSLRHTPLLCPVSMVT